MTKLAFLLHLYQPVTQDEWTFKKIAKASYIPLIKLIKNKKINVTLNIPLSLLEQMDNYGYSSWIKDIKELVEQEIINVTGSAAYHSLLTKAPKDLAQQQIILNEYGNGFYIGRQTGFEGEQAILVRDFNGFFPPELAINKNIHNILNDFGYHWVIVNPTSTYGVPGVFEIEGNDCKIVSRNILLSDMLAFRRNAEIKDIIDHFLNKEDSVIAIDAETFGHHNTDGIFLFGKLVEALKERDVELLTVSDFVEDVASESKLKSLNDLEESTWAHTLTQKPYHFWEGNKIQDLQWELLNKTIKVSSDKISKETYEDMENVSLWQGDLPDDVKAEILLYKVMHSDQFWWASMQQVGDMYLYNKDMVEKSLELYADLAKLLGDAKYEKLVAEYSEKILEEIEQHENNNPTTLLPTT